MDKPICRVVMPKNLPPIDEGCQGLFVEVQFRDRPERAAVPLNSRLRKKMAHYSDQFFFYHTNAVGGIKLDGFAPWQDWSDDTGGDAIDETGLELPLAA